MAQIIDGKAVSASVKEEVAAETAKLRDEHGLKVGLAVVIVGSDPASRVYVNNKKKACEAVGFQSYEYALDESTTQEQLLDLVEVLNRDSRVNGILVQLPLPKHIDEKAVINAISPAKDVDAFHPERIFISKHDVSTLCAAASSDCLLHGSDHLLYRCFQ